MAQSDARFGYHAKFKREDHDLSRPFGFTAAPGMLLPIFADIATPGDSYYIKHDLTFLRTAPLAAPAMVDLKVHYETFFVPMQMIYQPFENTIFSLKNLQSSNYNLASLMNNNFPLFDYASYQSLITGSSLQRSVIHSDAFRMADMLDLNGENFAKDTRSASTFNPRTEYTPSFFPWQILAYQTIYQYYYRLDDKSQFGNSLCNFDQFYASTSAVAGSYQDFFKIYQRPWKFDYFTSIYRAPIVSDANLQKVLPQHLYYSDLVNANTVGIESSGNAANSTNLDIRSFVNAFNNTYDVTNQQLALSTAGLRQMFANEKLAMITGRTKKTYDAQVLAHYGIEVPHDVKHDITMIAHDTYPIHIGEVTSLSATSDASLGDLAGKGWCQSPDDAKKHKFTAPCHGVIMTIFSVEPEQRYFGGFNRINAVTDAFDIPTPEFDRLGNMPMFRYEAGSWSHNSQTTLNDIIGWKERYYFNKRRSPKTSLAFMNSTQTYQGVNSYESYMMSREPFSTGAPSQLPNYGRPDLEAAFYISRHVMDGMMLVEFQDYWLDGYQSGSYVATDENWNATPWLVYARDPFIVDSFEKITKVSWMSKDGEPVYDF